LFTFREFETKGERGFIHHGVVGTSSIGGRGLYSFPVSHLRAISAFPIRP
jgi:hypothetical protein